VAHVLIVSGAGAYRDPWHPFAETSDRLAEVLREAGHRVVVREDVPEALAALNSATTRTGTTTPAKISGPAVTSAAGGGTGPSEVDVLVVNAAIGPRTEADAAAVRGFRAFRARGGGVLAVHIALRGLLDLPEWTDVLGAAWVDGVTMHPERSRCTLTLHADRHPIVAGPGEMTLVDERYTHVNVADDVVPLVMHAHDGGTHPLVWARQHAGAPVVVDLLGHDAESYAAAAHRALIARAVTWLARRHPSP